MIIHLYFQCMLMTMNNISTIGGFGCKYGNANAI